MYEERMDKYINIISIIVVIIVAIFLIVFKIAPDLKKIKGSSDNFIDYDNIDTVIGIKTPTNINFLLVIEKEKVTNILFLSSGALCLYNQDIENKSLDAALKTITTTLKEQDVIGLTITEYPHNKLYKKAKEILIKSLTLEENTNTYQSLAKSLSIQTYEDNLEQLKTLESYSKNLIREYKNAKTLEELTKKDTDDNKKENKTTSNSTMREAADHVYQKLSTYAKTVANQEKNSPNLLITDIPANAELTLYPTEESWYYIKEHKVYAYINFKLTSKSYDFCYNGSIENIKEGKCA